MTKEHTDVIQSTSWKKDGKLLATSCKDKKVRILDPRASSPVMDVANSHQNIKDSRIVWLGDQDRILTTGKDSLPLRYCYFKFWSLGYDSGVPLVQEHKPGIL